MPEKKLYSSFKCVNNHPCNCKSVAKSRPKCYEFTDSNSYDIFCEVRVGKGVAWYSVKSYDSETSTYRVQSANFESKTIRAQSVTDVRDMVSIIFLKQTTKNGMIVISMSFLIYITI